MLILLYNRKHQEVTTKMTMSKIIFKPQALKSEVS